jgi:hypothetical protein
MFSKLIAVLAGALVIGVGTASATPLGQKADGLRLQGLAERYAYVQGVKADGLRWQAMARFYAKPPISATETGGDSADAQLGLAAALVVALSGAALVFVRRARRSKLAL